MDVTRWPLCCKQSELPRIISIARRGPDRQTATHVGNRFGDQRMFDVFLGERNITGITIEAQEIDPTITEGLTAGQEGWALVYLDNTEGRRFVCPGSTQANQHAATALLRGAVRVIPRGG